MIHNWLGVTDETKHQAERMAALGYAVFAADIYGKGVRPKSPAEAGALAGKFKADRKLLRERVALGLKTLRAQAEVEPARVVAAGYCFGGTSVLELARSGADLKGVHAGTDAKLALASIEDMKRIAREELAGMLDKLNAEPKVDGAKVRHG